MDLSSFFTKTCPRQVEMLEFCRILNKYHKPFEGHFGSCESLLFIHIFFFTEKEKDAIYRENEVMSMRQACVGLSLNSRSSPPDARRGSRFGMPLFPDCRQPPYPSRCLVALPAKPPAPLTPGPALAPSLLEYGPWKAIVINPRKAEVLLRQRAQ